MTFRPWSYQSSILHSKKKKRSLEKREKNARQGGSFFVFNCNPFFQLNSDVFFATFFEDLDFQAKKKPDIKLSLNVCQIEKKLLYTCKRTFVPPDRGTKSLLVRNYQGFCVSYFRIQKTFFFSLGRFSGSLRTGVKSISFSGKKETQAWKCGLKPFMVKTMAERMEGGSIAYIILHISSLPLKSVVGRSIVLSKPIIVFTFCFEYGNESSGCSYSLGLKTFIQITHWWIGP